MNQRTEILSKKYKPELSIVVYRADDSRKDFYLESHQINDEGKIMEGKPLLQQTIQEMVDVFFDERKDRSQLGGTIPENLLQYKSLPGGNYRLVWYQPAEIRMIHFKDQLHIPSGRAWMPAMIYIVDRNDLEVFAMKVNTRPKESTKLFRAPFHNVADDGDVCLGSAKVKKPVDQSFAAAIKYWEDLFWLSEFSHFNGATDPTKSGLGKVWKRLMKSRQKIKWSDIDELKELKNKSLKSILR